MRYAHVVKNVLRLLPIVFGLYTVFWMLYCGWCRLSIAAAYSFVYMLLLWLVLEEVESHEDG